MFTSTFDRERMLMPTQRTGANGSAPCDLGSDSQSREKLRRQNRELQERVEELGTLASTIAYDLKGSFGALTGFANVVQEDDAPLCMKQQQACLEHLAYTVDKLNNAVDELILSYARAMW